jgi:hypothetical protein
LYLIEIYSTEIEMFQTQKEEFYRNLRGNLPGIDQHLRVRVSDSLDLTLRFENSNGLSGEGAIDLDTLSDDGGSDQLSLRDLLNELVPGSLIEHNSIVYGFLDLTLGPLLLAALTTSHSCTKLRLLRLLDLGGHENLNE